MFAPAERSDIAAFALNVVAAIASVIVLIMIWSSN
jgi:hypothetical protein